MARLLLEGFESGNTGPFIPSSTTPRECSVVHDPNTVDDDGFELPMGGYYCLVLGGAKAFMSFVPYYGSTSDDVCIMLKFQPASAGTLSACTMLYFYNQNFTTVMTLRLLQNVPGFVISCNGSYYYSQVPFNILRWNQLSLYLKLSIDNATPNGTIKVNLNGQTAINETNIITNSESSASYFTMWQIQGYLDYNESLVCFDDVILTDDTAIPDDSTTFVVPFSPNANSTVEWTSTIAMDEYVLMARKGSINTLDANYLYAEGTGDDITFTFANDYSVDYEELRSVQLSTRVRRDGQPTPQNLSALFVMGSEYEYTLYSPLPLGPFEFRWTILNQNPATLSTWQISDLTSGFVAGLRTAA